MSAVESMKRVLGLYVEAVNVIQPSVPGLCHHRQRPPVALHVGMPSFTFHAITASRTMPTLCVLVIITGPSRKPESSTHVVPVISPLPFSVNHAAKTAPLDPFPRGSTAVTPVRTGPSPTFRGPSPEIRVVCPTSTPFTSVIALKGPGMPSNGTPKSRARGLVCAETRTAKNRTETHALR